MGGLLVMCLLIIGWILNLGSRLDVVSRLYRDDQPYFRGFKPWRHTFKRGCMSFLAISGYLSPAVLTGAIAFALKRTGHESTHWAFAVLSALCFVLGVFTLPGCMTVYACEQNPEILKHPVKAFQRAWRQRRPYFKAWRISIAAVALSPLGLMAFGVGFFFTSVWAWEVVGYVFTIAMYMESYESP